MMLKFRRSLNIHVPGIPLIGKGRNAVNAPMDKNTEFCLHEPVRHGMVPQALPGILIRSLCDYLFYFFQIFLQLRHQSVTTPFWSMTLAYSAVSPVAMIAYAFFCFLVKSKPFYVADSLSAAAFIFFLDLRIGFPDRRLYLITGITSMREKGFST